MSRQREGECQAQIGENMARLRDVKKRIGTARELGECD